MSLSMILNTSWLIHANTEKEQTDVLNNMFVLLEKFDTNPKKQLIMAGDFNLFFDSKLDVQDVFS